MKRNEQKKHACGLGSGGAIPESCGSLLWGEGVRVREGCSGRRDLKFDFGPFGVPFLENQTHRGSLHLFMAPF